MAMSFYVITVLLLVSGSVAGKRERDNEVAAAVNQDAGYVEIQDENYVTNRDEDHVSIPLNLGRGHRGMALIRLATSGAEQTEATREPETTQELGESTAAKNSATESLTPAENNNEEGQSTGQIVLRLPKRVLCHLIRGFGQRTDQFGMAVKKSHFGRGQHARRRLSHTVRKLVRELMEMQQDDWLPYS